jgi:hypothetical protein
VMWVMANGKKMYLLFRMKELTNFAFALFAKSTCCFPLVFVNYYQMAFSICQLLPNGDKFTEGRFYPRRLLTAEAATVRYFQGGYLGTPHSGLLIIGLVGFPYFTSCLPVTRPARSRSYLQFSQIK